MTDVEKLRAELVDASKVAACAYQAWKLNDFDVPGAQKMLLELALKYQPDEGS